MSGYFGNPYEGCRPECVLNSDCPENKACINNKCEDPCPGVCGSNAQCQTVNHIPKCSCVFGYIGNPYENCIYKEGTMLFFLFYIYGYLFIQMRIKITETLLQKLQLNHATLHLVDHTAHANQ